MNTDTDTLDLSKFSAQLRSSGLTLEDYKNKLSLIGSTGTQAFMDMTKVISQAELPLRRSNKLLESLWVTMKNTMRWQLTSSAMHGFIGGVQTAYGYCQDLNESLNRIQIVTEKSTNAMAEFAKQANQAARNLSTTTTGYTDAALIYYQQGLTDEQVLERTNTTIKLANVAGETAETASQQLTAVWNNFYDGSKSLEYYADVMTALGAATASSTQEISQGLEKFAAIADTVGLSYEYATTALATITAETRQSADVVGTSLKTLFARIQGLQQDETQEDGTTLNKYSEALANIGVNIKTTSGDLKDMDTILDETAARWKTLSNTQQMALAQTVAGVRQYTQFITLMENWDKFQTNLVTATGAEGTLNKQAEIYAESWEAARKRVRTAAEDIYSSLINEDFFIGADNVITVILERIDDVIDSLGGFGGVLITVGTLMTSIYGDKMAQGIRNIGYNISQVMGIEQARAIQLKQQANDELQRIAAESSTPEIVRQIAQAYSRQAEQQININQAASQLNEFQREQLQQEMQLLDLTTKRAVAYGDAATAAKESTEVLQATIQDGSSGYTQTQIHQNVQDYNNEQGRISAWADQRMLALKAVVATGGPAGFDFGKDSAETIQRLSNAYVSLKERQGQLRIQGQELATSQQQVAKANMRVSDTSQKAADASDALTVAEQNYGKKSKEYIQAQKQKQQADQAAIKARDELTKAQTRQDTAQARIDALANNGQTGNQPGNVIQQLQNQANAIITVRDATVQMSDETRQAWNEMGQEANTAGANMERMSLSLQDQASQAEQVQAKIASLQSSIGDWSNKIVRGAQVMGQLAMAWNSLRNLGRIFSDEDLSTGEKLTGIMTSLAMVIPAVVSAFRFFTDSQHSTAVISAVVTAAMSKQNVELGAGIFNSWAKAAANKILAGSEAGVASNARIAAAAFAAQLITILPYIAAIGALVAVIYSLVQAYNADANAAKEAEKNAEAQKKAYEDLKQSYDNLKKSLEEYQNARKGLDELTKGTDEWKIAIQELNEQVLTLLDTYPQLAQYISNNDGILEISQAGQDALLKAQEQKVQQGFQTSLLASISAKEARNKANITDYTRQTVIPEAGTRDGPYGSGEKIQVALPISAEDTQKVLDALATQGESILENSDSLANATGITKSAAQAILNNREALVTLSSKVVANTEAVDLMTQQLGASILEDDTTYQSSRYKDQLASLMGDKVNDLYQNKYYDIYKDKPGGMEDEKIQKQYADLMGYQWVANLNGNKGTYLVNGETQEIDDATARAALAKQAAEEAALVDVTALDTALDALANTTTSENENVKNALANFALGVTDLSELTKAEKDAVEAANFNDLSEETLSALGISSADELTKLRAEAISAWDDNMKSITNGMLKSAKNAFNTLNSSDQFSQLSLSGHKLIAQVLEDAMVYGGQESLDVAQDTIGSLNPQNMQAFTNVLAKMDWSIDEPEDFIKALDEVGIKTGLTEQELLDFAEVMSRAGNDQTFDAIAKKYAEVTKVMKDLKEGDVISQEDFNKLGKGADQYFTKMLDGTYKLTGDAEEFYNATMQGFVNDYNNVKSQLQDKNQVFQNVQNYGVDNVTGAATIGDYAIDQNKVNLQLDLLQAKSFDPEQIARWSENLRGSGGRPNVEVLNEIAQAVDNLGLSESALATDISTTKQEMYDLDVAMLYSKNTIDELEAAQQNLNIAEEDYKKVLDDVTKKEAEKYDLDVDDVKDLAKAYLNEADAIVDTEEAARKLAIQNLRMNKGIKTLTDNWEDWSKVINKVKLGKLDKTTSDYVDTVQDLTDAIADLVGASEDLELSEEFFDSAKNLKLIEDSAKGSETAVNQLGVAVAQDMIANFKDLETVETQLHDVQNRIFEETGSWKPKGASEELQREFNELNNLKNNVDTVQTGFNDLFAAIGDGSIKAGDAAAMLDADWVTAMNSLAASTGMTVTEMNDMLSAAGIEAEVVTEPKEVTQTVPKYRTVEIVKTLSDGTHGAPAAYEKTSQTYPDGYSTFTGVMEVAQINMGTENKGKKPTYVGSGHISPSSTTTSGSSKGGGSSAPKGPKEFKKAKEQEQHRYENIDSSIQSVTRSLDRLQAKEEDAWGSAKLGKLKALNAEIAVQNGLLSARYKEALKYYNDDKWALENNADINLAGFDKNNILYNPDNTIANAEEIKDALYKTLIEPAYEAYNQLVAQGIDQETGADQYEVAEKGIEDSEERYEKALAALEQLDSSAGELEDTFNNILDNIRTSMSNIIEYIQTKLELRINVSERDMNRIEKLIDRWGDTGIITGRTYELYGKQMELLAGQAKAVETAMKEEWSAYSDLQAARDQGVGSDVYKRVTQTLGLTPETQAAFDEWIEGNGALPAELMEAMQSERDKAMEVFDNIVDTALEQLNVIFEEANQHVEKILNEAQQTMNFNEALTNLYKSQMEFMGIYNATTWEAQQSERTVMMSEMKGQGVKVENAIAQRNVYKGMADELQTVMDTFKTASIKVGANGEYEYAGKTVEEWEQVAKDAEEKLAKDTLSEVDKQKIRVDKTVAELWMNYGAGAINAMQQQVNEWNEKSEEAMVDIVNSQEEFLQMLTDNIEREKEMASNRVGRIFGGLFTTISDMQEMFDTFQQAENMQFDDYDKNYQLDRLTGMYDNIADELRPDQMKYFEDYLETINKYKKDGVNLTEGEVGLLEKQFEIAKEKAAWEEAQNNKNMMRLTRDESGNYSYVYTSSDTEDDRTQRIKDLEYEYKNMLEDIQNNLMGSIGDIASQMEELFKSIDWQLFQADDQYRNSILMRAQAFMTQFNISADEASRVFDGVITNTGEWANVWEGSAGAIITQKDSLVSAFDAMRLALVGTQGLTPDNTDSSSIFGAIMGAQEYWANEVNNELLESCQHLTADDQEYGIPNQFSIITERVKDQIDNTVALDKNGTPYHTFKTESETLRNDLNDILLGNENSLWFSYKTLGGDVENLLVGQKGPNGEKSMSVTYEEFKTKANQILNGDDSVSTAHGTLLQNIQTVFGDSESTDDNTINGRYNNLSTSLSTLATESGGYLDTMAEKFTSWATTATAEIGKVIAAIAELTAAVNGVEDDAADDAAGKDVENPFGNPGDDKTETKPGTTSTSHAQQAGVLSEGDIKAWAFSGGNAAADWASHPGYKVYQGIQSKVSDIDFEKIKNYTKTQEYQTNVTNAGWATVLQNAGLKQYLSWEELIKDYYKYDTGGYTGDWGTTDGKFAMLHEKELVLNKDDTQNILDAVEMVRQIALIERMLDGNAFAAMSLMADKLSMSSINTAQEPLEQNIHIDHVEFPNVTSSDEIKDAFQTIANDAAQWARRRRD